MRIKQASVFNGLGDHVSKYRRLQSRYTVGAKVEVSQERHFPLGELSVKVVARQVQPLQCVRKL
jgi:hypothetical protein